MHRDPKLDEISLLVKAKIFPFVTEIFIASFDSVSLMAAGQNESSWKEAAWGLACGAFYGAASPLSSQPYVLNLDRSSCSMNGCSVDYLCFLTIL